MDRAVEIFAAIVRTAPFGRYTARAQFDIGLARQKQHANDAAIQAYQAVIDKFPSDAIAADAQYQIAYIWYEASRLGTNDQAATEKARNGFEDFLFRYPKSEKAAQARENLEHLQQKSTGDAMKVAKFYDKKKAYRAAVIYYNEVIQEHPGSAASAEAQRRVDQIRPDCTPTRRHGARTKEKTGGIARVLRQCPAGLSQQRRRSGAASAARTGFEPAAAGVAFAADYDCPGA